jgi:hypothetical protein
MGKWMRPAYHATASRLGCILPQAVQQLLDIFWKFFGHDISCRFSHHFADLLDDGVGSLTLTGHADITREKASSLIKPRQMEKI